MRNEDMIIYVPQELIRDQGCSHLDIVVWCYLLMEIYSPYIKKSMVSAAQIAYQIKESNEYTRNFVSDIADSIRNLLEAGYIKGERVDRMHYVIQKDSFNPSEYNYFVQIKADDLRLIMRETSRPNSTLHYYLVLLSTINREKKCGYWSNESLADILDNDATIITRHMAILEKIGLIYVYRNMNTTNTYGRFEDKDVIIAQGKARSNGSRVTKASNIKRRMTQMYNRVKAGHTYDPVIMEEIRDYCQRKNDETGENFYDLSIFSVDFARDAS